jgi:hypothetical protein
MICDGVFGLKIAKRLDNVLGDLQSWPAPKPTNDRIEICFNQKIEFPNGMKPFIRSFFNRRIPQPCQIRHLDGHSKLFGVFLVSDLQTRNKIDNLQDDSTQWNEAAGHSSANQNYSLGKSELAVSRNSQRTRYRHIGGFSLVKQKRSGRTLPSRPP